MKINVIACCKNEERILPFFLDYYSEFCDTITIADGHSTDNSVEIIKQYPKAVLVNLDEGKELHDGELHDIRNEYYKQFRGQYDWQIVVDVDEFVYAEDILNVLEEYQREGVTIPRVEGYNMGSMVFPVLGIPLVKQVTRGVSDALMQNKLAIFNPQVDINYHIGCHWAEPSGNVKWSKTYKIKLLHYRYLSYKHFIDKSTWADQRRSRYNIDNGFGIHYSRFIKMTEEEYQKMVADMKPVI